MEGEEEEGGVDGGEDDASTTTAAAPHHCHHHQHHCSVSQLLFSVHIHSCTNSNNSQMSALLAVKQAAFRTLDILP